MEKQLLTYEKEYADMDIKTIQAKVIPEIIENIIPIYKELGLGPIDKDVLNDLMYSGGIEVEANYNKSNRDQMKQAGIKSQIVINKMIGDCLEPLQRLQNVMTLFNTLYGAGHLRYDNNRQHNLASFVSFEKGKPFLSDASIEEIRECYKKYLSTDGGNSLRELHLKAVNTVNELFTYLQETGFSSPHPARYYGLVFKINEGATLTVSPTDLNYDEIARIMEAKKSEKVPVKKFSPAKTLTEVE